MLFNQVSSPWTLVVAGLALMEGVTAQNKYPITGLKTGINAQTGERPVRKNIIDLQNNVPQFSLFIQAWNEVQALQENNLTSYYQLAGIHGLPHAPWDNVTPAPGQGISSYGYCNHGDVLFSLWHRPYLALLEQVIGAHAQIIAKKYNSAVYTKAANDLRFPYWDWATRPFVFPTVLTTVNVNINTPTGTKSVKNPLLRYKFLRAPEPDFPVGADLSTKQFTVRMPDANWASQDAMIQSSVRQQVGEGLAFDVYDVFARTTTFNSMSTSNEFSGGNSFESPHGTVHILIASNERFGHMGPVDFAGFDPIFWMHHTNVDRLIAMWQATHPNAWLTPGISPAGTYTMTPGTAITENTKLEPFTTGDKKTRWTAKTSRNIKSFGYSYPEIRDWALNPTQLAAEVTQKINTLYAPPEAFAKRAGPSSRIMARDVSREWRAVVTVPNAALGEGFSVLLNVGDVFVGRSVVVGSPNEEELAKGVNKFTYAEILLNRGLQGLPSTSVEEVAAYLKENLKVTIEKNADKSTVPLDQFEGLEIHVQDTIVTPAADITSFPTYGKITVHPDITA